MIRDEQSGRQMTPDFDRQGDGDDERHFPPRGRYGNREGGQTRSKIGGLLAQAASGRMDARAAAGVSDRNFLRRRPHLRLAAANQAVP